MNCKNKNCSHLDKFGKSKELIIKELRESGCRVTKQRMLIIDVILKSDISCCKEIYCEVAKIDPTVGIATVYRMIRQLEEIGAINRKNMYRMTYQDNSTVKSECTVLLKDKRKVEVSSDLWRKAVKTGLASIIGVEEEMIQTVLLRKTESCAE